MSNTTQSHTAVTQMDIHQNLKNDLLVLRRHRHIQRYLSIRRFCYGHVVDFGCGSGYGLRILSESKDIKSIEGIEPNTVMLGYVKNPSLMISSQAKEAKKIDTLVALEVIEHLDASGMEEFLKLVSVAQLTILSFPDKMTTSFNEEHRHDYVRQDVVDLLQGYCIPLKIFRQEDSTIILFLRRPEDMPTHLYRNILDL